MAQQASALAEQAQILGELLREIPRASFISIKLFTTGHARHSPSKGLWEYHLIDSLTKHRPIQLGMALFYQKSALSFAHFSNNEDIDLFEDDSKAREQSNRKWEAKSYTLSLFPSFSFSSERSTHFELDHAQMQKLLQRGWDIDTWIDNSISYIGLDDEKEIKKIKQMRARNFNARVGFFEPPKDDFRTVAFLESLRSSVDDWLVRKVLKGNFIVRDEHITLFAEDENTLGVLPGNSYFSFLVFWLVEKEFPQLVLEVDRKKIRIKKIPGQNSIDPRAAAKASSSPDSKAVHDLLYESSIRQFQLSRSVIDLLFRSKKTIVGYDMLEDLFLLHCSFLGDCGMMSKPPSDEEAVNKMKRISTYFLEAGISVVDLATKETSFSDVWDLYDKGQLSDKSIIANPDLNRADRPPGQFDAGYLTLLLGDLYINTCLNHEVGFSNIDTDRRIVHQGLKLSIQLNELTIAMGSSSVGKRDLSESVDVDVEDHTKKRKTLL